MCVSMKPGTTIIPRASITRAPAPASLRTSALDPTAAIRSPCTAIASTHGRRPSPVHTRALTTARVIGASGIGGALAQAVAVMETRSARQGFDSTGCKVLEEVEGVEGV